MYGNDLHKMLVLRYVCNQRPKDPMPHNQGKHRENFWLQSQLWMASLHLPGRYDSDIYKQYYYSILQIKSIKYNVIVHTYLVVNSISLKSLPV